MEARSHRPFNAIPAISYHGVFLGPSYTTPDWVHFGLLFTLDRDLSCTTLGVIRSTSVGVTGMKVTPLWR